MMTQNTDNAQPESWRDLADKLPASLVGRYEAYERYTEDDYRMAFPGQDPAAVAQKIQRHMLEEAVEQAKYAHVSLPAGADTAETWDDDGTGSVTRVVAGPYRLMEAEVNHGGVQKNCSLGVGLTGIQTTDGAVQWGLFVSADDEPITSESARAFAANIMDVADELEKLERAQ